MSKNILIISSILSILLFRLFSIAPFDPPDEQSHLAQINFYVSEGRMPNLNDDKNLSVEEVFAERVIGTMSEGENRYFFHPEYRYELADGVIGKYETEIQSYNTRENRSTYVVRQASTYPPLYYWITSWLYKLSGSQDFFYRLYISRFSSLLFTLLIPFVAYHFGKKIWGKGFMSTTLAYMVLLFPMTTYLGVGSNSDNLHFLLFGYAILLMISLIKDGFSTKLSASIGIVIGLDLLTKPQSYTLFPILAFAVLIRFRFDEWKTMLKQLPFLLVPILAISGWQELPKLILGNDKVSATAYLAREINFGGWDNFLIFSKDYIRTHLTEVIVWYWGVFKWSGIILPRFFWWIANRLMLIAAIGVVVRFIRDIRKRQFSYIARVMLFSIISNAIYIFAIFMFDWQFYQEYGRSLGLQGRYYMPLLITHMFLLLSGMAEFISNKGVQKWMCNILICFFLAIHLSSVYVQLKSYYDLFPTQTLINQISQYKPFFAKGSWWYLWFTLYFTGIITTTYLALRGEKNK